MFSHLKALEEDPNHIQCLSSLIQLLSRMGKQGTDAIRSRIQALKTQKSSLM